jgi:predicted GTPase
MNDNQIDPRFTNRPHGDRIFINQMYGYEEQLRLRFFSDKNLEAERQQLLDEVDVLITQLDQPINVVIAGGFNAGKSMFVNALLDRDIMPVKAIRATATVNCLIAGKRKECMVFRKNGKCDAPTRYASDFDINQKIRSLMEKEYESIAHIEIACPDQRFLDRFTLIDTPGLDHSEQDSATSLHWVAKADAIIWLLHNEGLRKEDKDNISRFHAANPDSPLIVIINQIDTLEANEKDDVFKSVSTKLQGIVQHVFLLSAKLAFYGRKEKDASKIEESLFNELSHYLHNHLFNAYRDIQEQRIRQRGQALGQKLSIFLNHHSGDSTMLPVSDLSPQIEKLHKSYLEKKSCNIQALDASRTKEDFDLLKRFYESSAIKAGLVNILRYTHQLISFEEQLSQREKDELSTLTDNIENAVFRVGVFGSFSSGKSTLINHLLGNTNLLPVDEDRCTAAYTLIQRADDKNPSGTVRIEWKAVDQLLQDMQDCAQSLGLGLENLPTMTDETKLLDWVKQNDSQFKKIEEELKERDDWDLADDLNRKKQVALALLQGLPQYRQLQNKYKILDGSKLKTLMQDEPAVTLVQCLQFYHDHPLLRHVQIIDSPGSGSVNLRDAYLAHSLVKQSHALLFLTEATAPISKLDETNLLAVIGKNAPGGQINSLFVLANKTDLSDNSNNPERIVQKITERMEKYFKGRCQARKIYPISCKTGLNLEQFTADLNHFLQADKDAFFLENTSKNVERFIEKLLQNLDNQLKKRDESLLDIADIIEAFQKDKVENQESIASHLKSYELIYYKSKQEDIFNIGKILIRTFDERLSYFKDALKSNLSNVSRKNKKVIIINNINQHITDVAKLSMSIIESEIEKEFSECNEKTKKALQKIEAELARKYRVFENASFCDLYDTELNFYGLIDKIKTSSFNLAGLARLTSLALGIGGFMFDPITGIALLIATILINIYIKTGGSDNKKLVDKVTNVMKNSFNGNWEDIEKNNQKAIYLSIKDQFDRIIQRDIENISEEHRKLFNQFLQSIEEKLKAQYLEKQKSETERQMLQRNRCLISEELKFLKNEQAYFQNQLQKLYAKQAVN